MSFCLRLAPTLRCAAALLLLSHDASAQLGGPCFSDLECEEGFVCSVNPASDAGSSVAVEDTVAADAAPPELPALPEVDLGGNCVPDLAPCTDDADCEDGYHCELHGTGSNTRSCEESGTCNASEAGEGAWLCAPNELSCEVDSDCPEPAVCSEGECFYELNSCALDSDCEPRYVCSASTNEGSCESDADDGSEECADDLIHMCFPPPVECESDSDCDGWICHAVPQSGNPPIGWEALDKACMPPGLVALIEDRIEARGDVVGDTNGDRATTAPSGAPADTAERDAGVRSNDSDGKPSTEPDEAQEEVQGDDEAADENADENGADDPAEGCNVAAGNASKATWLPVLFAMALLRSRRTTRRRTQR